MSLLTDIRLEGKLFGIFPVEGEEPELPVRVEVIDGEGTKHKVYFFGEILDKYWEAKAIMGDVQFLQSRKGTSLYQELNILSQSAGNFFGSISLPFVNCSERLKKYEFLDSAKKSA